VTEDGGSPVERHDDDRAARADEDALAESAGNEHPARPESGGDDGFATGIDRKPDTPEEELEPNFARGISAEGTPETERRGRFSDGQEELPDTPDKNVERRFSEGIERSPTSD
jgi:hypothetical protein